MIRLIQRRLIIPRGDTGTFSIPMLPGKDAGDVSIFTIFDPLVHRKVFEKSMNLAEWVLNIEFTHNDTVNLPVGQYVWDIKFYSDPQFVDGKLVNGTEIDSYYAAFALPVCEIRETGDSLLTDDNAPQATLAPDQLDIITAAITEVQAAERQAVDSAAEANASAGDAETAAAAAQASERAALESQNAAEEAQREAAESATAAQESMEQAQQIAQQIHEEIPTKVSELENDSGYLSEETDPTVPEWAKQPQKPTYTAQEVGALPANTVIPTVPTNVSAFTNDAGYLTEHQDISGKANAADLAAVATSGSYNDLEDKPVIPSKVSDLTDDSGHYTKPVSGIPASDLANGVLDVWSGLTYHTSTMSTDSDSFVLGGATDAPTEINKCLVTSTPSANVIPKFDYQGRLHSVTPEEEWDGSNTVATTEYVDNMISGNMPDVPTAVSELENDAGYITGYIETDPTVPAWAKAAQKPTYTAAEVGAPTVQEMNTAIGNAIGNINSFDMAVVQALPTENISTHTIYLVPKTGETNDVYDEYVYVNSAWEMVGNTQIDLSNKADKADTVLETTLSRGRKENTTIGGASLAFGIDTEASGYYSVALGLNTTASSQGAFAEGKNTVAHYIAHAEGENSQALSSWSHAQNVNTIANGGASSASGRSTIANGADSFVFGRYNAADSYDNWPTWTANTSYEVGDRVKRNLMVQNEPTDVGYHCTVANSDATFDNAHWELDGYHMNYVEIVGNGKEYEDPETHQTVRAGSNAYALEWNGTAHFGGDVYVGANADSSGGTKVATVNDIPDTSIYATKDSIDNAGIADRTYITKYDGSITTALDSTYESPWCELPNVEGEFACRKYRVTFDNVIYELRAGLFNKYYNNAGKGVEFIGDLSMYIDTTGCLYEVYDVPFCIIDNAMDYADGILVFSKTAGEHTLKLELELLNYDKLPPELIYGKSESPIIWKHNSGSSYFGISIGSGSNILESTRNVIAIGSGNKISGVNGHAYGVDNTVSGLRSIAIGLRNNTTGQDNYAFGYNCSTSGEGSLAVGYQTQSSGGYGSIATGYVTTASGMFAHSEGSNSIASGNGSHAENMLTTASGQNSHAEGWRTIANHRSQHVFGQANVADSSTAAATALGTYAEIVGNGTAANARSNARALDWNGNEYLAGNIYVGANADSTGGTRLATVTELAAKLDAAEAGLKVVRLI